MAYIQAGHFEASGAAVTLTWDLERNPDFLLLVNETQFAADAKNILGFHFKHYAAGDMSILINDTTDGVKGTKEVTNGITQNDSVAYADTANSTAATHTLNLSLGSAFYGADSDEIHFLAIWADKHSDLGDLNA